MGTGRFRLNLTNYTPNERAEFTNLGSSYICLKFVSKDYFSIAHSTSIAPNWSLRTLGAKKEHPDEPRVIYDGYDHAIFMRRPEERIILDYIHPEVRDQLRKARRVVMVETILENIKESYYADMQVVDKIPVDWSKIGLKTWEEIVLKDKQV